MLYFLDMGQSYNIFKKLQLIWNVAFVSLWTCAHRKSQRLHITHHLVFHPQFKVLPNKPALIMRYQVDLMFNYSEL